MLLTSQCAEAPLQPGARRPLLHRGLHQGVCRHSSAASPLQHTCSSFQKKKGDFVATIGRGHIKVAFNGDPVICGEQLCEMKWPQKPRAIKFSLFA